MPFIIVKSGDTIIGVIRQGPQTKTTAPPWMATRPDEACSAECHTFWSALAYLRGEPVSVVGWVKHNPFSRESMADPPGPCHTLTLAPTETHTGRTVAQMVGLDPDGTVKAVVPVCVECGLIVDFELESLSLDGKCLACTVGF